MNFDLEYAQLKDHVLVPVEIGDKIQLFSMKPKSGGYAMSTTLIFTNGRIVITGDLTPGRYGSVSCGGYGIGWFGSNKSPSYLAEKFLEKVYESDRAENDFSEYLKERAAWAWDDRDSEAIHNLRELRNHVNENFYAFENGYSLYEVLSDFDYSLVDDGLSFGWGYPSSDWAWLCAIQKKFSELYQDWLKTPDGVDFLSKDS